MAGLDADGEALGVDAEDGDLWRRVPSLEVRKVELRLYRRLRTSADNSPCPPRFIYHVGCRWSGAPTPGSPPRLHARPASEGRVAGGSSRPGSPAACVIRFPATPSSAVSSAAWSTQSPRACMEPGKAWWHDLPSSYTVRRQWSDLVRFHHALVNELAYDQELKRWRVKSRVPPLPNSADPDAWLNCYAAIGDAYALGRRQPLASLDRMQERSIEELGDLEWIYVENRLAPYFHQVNQLLQELPTSVLLASKPLKRLFTSGGVSGRAPLREDKVHPVPTRFLGPLVPLCPDKEDLAKAARQFRRAASSTGFAKAAGAHLGGQAALRGSASLPKL